MPTETVHQQYDETWAYTRLAMVKSMDQDYYEQYKTRPSWWRVLTLVEVDAFAPHLWKIMAGGLYRGTYAPKQAARDLRVGKAFTFMLPVVLGEQGQAVLDRLRATGRPDYVTEVPARLADSGMDMQGLRRLSFSKFQSAVKTDNPVGFILREARKAEQANSTTENTGYGIEQIVLRDDAEQPEHGAEQKCSDVVDATALRECTRRFLREVARLRQMEELVARLPDSPEKTALLEEMARVRGAAAGGPDETLRALDQARAEAEEAKVRAREKEREAARRLEEAERLKDQAQRIMDQVTEQMLELQGLLGADELRDGLRRRLEAIAADPGLDEHQKRRDAKVLIDLDLAHDRVRVAQVINEMLRLVARRPASAEDLERHVQCVYGVRGLAGVDVTKVATAFAWFWSDLWLQVTGSIRESWEMAHLMVGLDYMPRVIRVPTLGAGKRRPGIRPGVREALALAGTG